jgi:hypothetical protein
MEIKNKTNFIISDNKLNNIHTPANEIIKNSSLILSSRKNNLSTPNDSTILKQYQKAYTHLINSEVT